WTKSSRAGTAWPRYGREAWRGARNQARAAQESAPGAPSSAPEPDRPTMGRMTEQGETIRTAILTVDDDPGVSRAVARDLRRRYGERNRIVRAESGASALEALRQMKLRGHLVAVILADYRM